MPVENHPIMILNSSFCALIEYCTVYRVDVPDPNSSLFLCAAVPRSGAIKTTMVGESFGTFSQSIGLVIGCNACAV
jgi:hypothetical protein